MRTNIKTWQARMHDVYGQDTRGFKPDSYMLAEIADLRAALAAAQAKITELEVAGCTDSYALQSAIATQAPSAPVAPPVTEKMATFYLSTSGEYCTHQVGDCKVPVWLKDHSNAEAFMLIMDSLLSRASAALSVKAGTRAIVIKGDEYLVTFKPDDDVEVVWKGPYLAAPTPPTTGEA